MTPQERKTTAMENFMAGYNCAQAVALAFKDIVDIDEKALSRLAAPFGGGMGRLREVCGAVSAMFMVTGLVYGYDTPETGDKKIELYKKVQALAAQVEEKYGSIVCRTLLGKPAGKEAPVPEQRTPDFYSHRPCTAIIGDAAEILATFIEENPVA